MDYTVSKTLRSRRHLSERQFALQAGISRSILRKLEAGSSDIRLESLKLLCTELGRNLDIMLSPPFAPRLHAFCCLSFNDDRSRT